jgi:CubicO group peptidase (beta-lactamase class C family)
MQLVEQGKVILDDPVEKYVPQIKSLQGYSDRTIIKTKLQVDSRKFLYKLSKGSIR